VWRLMCWLHACIGQESVAHRDWVLVSAVLLALAGSAGVVADCEPECCVWDGTPLTQLYDVAFTCMLSCSRSYGLIIKALIPRFYACDIQL
jgi:hypothetical protein